LKDQRARGLLGDEFFKSEMDLLEQSQIDIIVNSAPHESEEREEAYRMQLAIKKIRAHFQSLAADSEIEKKRWKIL
jgi:hypothetical protein